jgi:hypothetical protein
LLAPDRVAWPFLSVQHVTSPVVHASLRFQGFDHGVGHSLLLLYDVKAPNAQKSKEFKDLGHYLSDASLSIF